MPTPSSRRYLSQGRLEGVDGGVLVTAVETIERIRATDPRITPIFTLKHLSHITDIPFKYLRCLVARRADKPYKCFYLKKKIPSRRRVRRISVPEPNLMKLQRWIVDNILRYTDAHSSSYAFHPDCRPYEAALVHCKCSWLLKIDLEDFFHTISEGRITSIFANIGFPKLLSFELARLVTVACKHTGKRIDSAARWSSIPDYQCQYEGVLPQGAPTSPMLANLAMLRTDEVLSQLALRHGMKYTRYADDLAFSCEKDKDIMQVRRFKRLVLEEINRAGFRPNHRKTAIRGPGSRRIVLGMLVDSNFPRLPRKYKNNIQLHLYYLESASHGPSAHAKARKTSVSGIFHHVRGLIAWAETVEPEFGKRALERFQAISWPPLGPQ